MSCPHPWLGGRRKLKEGGDLAKPTAACSAPGLSMHILAAEFLGFPEQLARMLKKLPL